MNKYAILVIGIFIVALLLVTCSDIRRRHEINARDVDYRAVQDTLRQSRNKLGQQQTVTLSLQSDYKTAKAALQNVRDSASIRLREEINSRTQAAITASTVTHSKGTDKSTVKPTDTLKKGGIQYVYPTYTATINNRWETGFISANKDSIHHDIKIRNEFDFRIEKPKFSLFKKQAGPTITMVNRNPNCITTELKSFVIAPKPAYRGYYFLGGFLIAIIAEPLIRR